MMKSVVPQQRRFSQPFFHDPHTHTKISEIAGQETLVIYAGLGVTVDRTKKNWRGLIEEMLRKDPLRLTDSQVKAVFAAGGGSTIASASIGFELFVDAVGAGALPAVQKSMREMLYPTTLISETGRLVTAIASLMDAWALAGRTVILVTTNYEDLLLELLRGMTSPEVDVVYVEPETLPAEADRLLATPGIKYVYLHGSVPDNGPYVRPVLHERDYFETETPVRGFLDKLFEKASTLFIGTSLHDPPLISALLAKVPAEFPRWAVTPLQDPVWPREIELREMQVNYHDLRLRHLEVDGIYPDYFGQIAQFLEEILECHNKHTPYESVDFGSRYGQRLCRWWDDWEAKRGQQSNQPAAHRALASFLENDLKHLLRVSNEELKVEIWLRWNPRERRDLALWASSVGTWRAQQNMRFVPIGPDSDFVAVDVFTQGRIVAPRPAATGRWKAFAGVPLTYKEENSAPVPIGAAVIASMQGTAPGMLVDRARSALLGTALEKLQFAGDQIVRSGRWMPALLTNG